MPIDSGMLNRGGESIVSRGGPGRGGQQWVIFAMIRAAMLPRQKQLGGIGDDLGKIFLAAGDHRAGARMEDRRWRIEKGCIPSSIFDPPSSIAPPSGYAPGSGVNNSTILFDGGKMSISSAPDVISER